MDLTPMLLTTRQVARASSLSEAFIRKLGQTGKLEVVRIGRAVRIPRRALLKLCGAEQPEPNPSQQP